MKDNRISELENIPRNFIASLQPIISRYRLRDGVNEIEMFSTRVNEERARTKRKLETFRNDPNCASVAHVIAATEEKVDAIADSEIARCTATGIEFCTLTAALQDTSRSISAAVDKLENKGMKK